MRPMQSLYALAEEENIRIHSFPMPQSGSMSLPGHIGMDPGIQDGGACERTHLIHELGHCVTGSFYNVYASRDLRRRHEDRADKWAVRNLIPAQALDDAVAQGYTTMWELAEHFGVTEDFIRKAVCLHTHGNLATQLYF